MLGHSLLTDGAHGSSLANDGDSIPLAMETGSEKDGILARPMTLGSLLKLVLTQHYLVFHASN